MIQALAVTRQENTPEGRASIAFVMSEIASNGDAGVNKLIEAVGIEALVKMAKQENTPNGRADIAFVMGEIAKIGAAEVKALGGIEALVAMAKQENFPAGRHNIAFTMVKIARIGDAGLNKLIEAGGRCTTPATGKYSPNRTTTYCVCNG